MNESDFPGINKGAGLGSNVVNVLRTGRPFLKGTGLGMLGIALACLGCCLPPLLGALSATGIASGIAVLASRWAAIAVALMGIAGIGTFLVLRRSKGGCCSAPGTACGPDHCASGLHGTAGRKDI